ncbi:MAG TPA: LuxR C-terminal-related transcriptional regulator [Dehalococcoidia bacterium]
MRDGLLSTKLHLPRLPAGLVDRARVVEQLEEGASRRLTLVSAPAGFGKTTAVSAWARATDRSVAWVLLDAGDNDPIRFWGYITGALETLEGQLGASASSLLNSPQPVSTETFLTVLLNELGALDRESTLVLEDYHWIETEVIHDGLAFLLEHLPSRVHVVMTTRADPPLPLSKLRAGDELIEVRASDLRFTGEEVASYLQKAVSVRLSDSQVSVLESRTEGWIVGLQMAALSMQGREDVDEFVQSLSGTHRYILDYLAEEVLQRQSPDVRSFLTKTSVLDKLSAPLCNAVTGGESSRLILDALERENLFLVALDDDRRWYRYHHLFAEFLRSHFAEDQPESVADLHRRASGWFAENEMVADAIDHSLAANDFEAVARLVDEHGETTLWRDAQHQTVLGWMDAIPEDIVQARPRLTILSAWTRLITGQWERVGPLLNRIEESADDLAESDGQRILGEAAAMRSSIAYESGEMEQAIELAGQALELLPEESGTIRAVAALNKGISHFAGGIAGAGEAYALADSIARQARNVTISLVAIGCRVQLSVRLGRLREASDAYEEAKRLGSVRAGPLLPPAGLACVHVGEVLRERNDLETAARVTAEGIELCEQQGGMPEHVLTGYTILARAEHARGDNAAAEEAMHRADGLLAELESRQGDIRRIVAQALTNRARWWLSRGELDRVEGWLEVSDAGAAPLIRVRSLIARGDLDAALDELDGPAVGAEAEGSVSGALEAQILRANIQQERGSDRTASELIDRALKIAEPEGYARLFLEEGETMRRLLLQAVERGSAYAGRLVTAASSGESEAVSVSANELNEREMAILRLMAAGLSNSDIASELFLSVNTVKWHARNLYGKLGVVSRSQAVARGRDLSLL